MDAIQHYDALGRAVQASTKKTIDPNAQVGDSDFVQSTTYDSAGRPETTTYPTGFGYRNVYNANGYLIEVRHITSNALYWSATSRDAEGHITRETLGNGLVTDHKYKADTSYLDTVQTGTLSGGTLTASVQNDAYSFDGIGNLVTRSQYFGSTSLTETFMYDSLNRLNSATVLGGPQKTAAYDEIGNVINRSDVGDYNYSGCGGAHRACSTGFSGLNSYDANGNMLGSDSRSLTWTSYNYPLQITQGSTTESFLYTPERERVRRTSVEGGLTTTTVYLNPRIDLGNTFEKTYKPGNVIEYTHYLYAGGQVIGSVVTSNPSNPAVPEVRYFHVDQLGSIMAVSNAAGVVTERLSYDAWGKRRNPDSTDDVCSVLRGQTTVHGYTQHEHLDSIDLVHMNGRVYDPVTGRFLSADPNVFYPENMQDFNRYSYVHNNPLSFIDPSGFMYELGDTALSNNYVQDLNTKSLLNLTITASINASQMTNSYAKVTVSGSTSQPVVASSSSGGANVVVGTASVGLAAAAPSDSGGTKASPPPSLLSSKTAIGDSRSIAIGEILMLEREGMQINGIDSVKVTNGGWFGIESQVMTPDGNIYVGTKNEVNLGWSEDYSMGSIDDRSIFVHESQHLYQSLNDGCDVACMGVKRAFNSNYDYVYTEGKPFSKYGLEEQAEMVMDRFRLENGASHWRTNKSTLDQLNSVIPF
ncbi:MAG: hypothetical protein PSX71_03605 [bacterium]|nr:hypothetical protein [bacterium]